MATLNGIIFSYQEILSITITDDQSGGSIQTNPASGYRVRNSCSQVKFIICKWEKYPLANVYKLESSMSPKQREQICWWSHQFASEKKFLLAKLCKCTEKLTLSPAVRATTLQVQQCNLLADAAYQTYSPLSILCFGTRVIKCDIDCFAQSSLHQPGSFIKEPAEFSRVQYVLLLFFTELNNWNWKNGGKFMSVKDEHFKFSDTSVKTLDCRLLTLFSLNFMSIKFCEKS